MILTVNANAAIDKRYVMGSFELGEVNRVRSVDMSAGGKGLNVSRAAHIAGEEVLATGFLGGHAGRFVQEKTQAEGIQDAFVWCDGETRSCINIWDETNRRQTELLEPGFEVPEDKQEELVKLFAEKIRTCSVATISGSLPKGCTPELYRKLISAGKAAGKKVILDTSGKTLMEGVHFEPFMIKPNIDEIRQLTGDMVDPDDKPSLIASAQKLHALGIPTVVISLGSHGSLMSCEEGAYIAHIPVIDAVNTVGCGDSMIGGFAVGIARGLAMTECLKLASAVSTAAAMTDKTGYFISSDMEKISRQINIEKISD